MVQLKVMKGNLNDVRLLMGGSGWLRSVKDAKVKVTQKMHYWFMASLAYLNQQIFLGVDPVICHFPGI